MSHEHDHKPLPAGPPAPPPSLEDTGSQALSEALRSSFVLLKILMGGLVLIFLFSGVRVIGPQERAIVLHFGKPVGEGEKALLGPGLHWAFPPPVDEIVRIPAGQLRTARSIAGWYLTTPEAETAKSEPPPGETLNPARDGYVLTADANIVHVRATLRYRITDPLRYEFDFTNTPALITNALNNAIFYAAAQFTVDSILTRDKTAFREKIDARLNQLIDIAQMGISVEQTDVEAIPPRQERVKTAFSAALQAGIKREKVLNEARAYASEIINRSRSAASASTNLAWTDRARLIEFVAAEANQFTNQLPQYEANPELFTLIRQTETLARVLTNAEERIFLPNPGPGQTRELRLLLGREPFKPKYQAPPPAPDSH